VKKILEQLTKITDLTILFASIFVFLAYITPESTSDASLNQEIANENRISASISTIETAITNSNARVEELINNTNDLRGSISSTTEQSIVDQLNSEVTENQLQIDQAQRELQAQERNLALLQSDFRSSQQRLKDIEAEDERAISWIQPVRQNTDRLIDAAGFDGFIAGFAALIFCLIIKRRRDWFRRMFGLYFK
tara:strand:- start:963 stop:1544 length:582 start_codon:yes stop_codon:yes gene_type:complete